MAYTLNRHGEGPFRIAVIHGGPGAAGSAAPLARGLCESFGVLEPIQTADTVDGQIAELEEALEDSFDQPGVVIGWSWGAWLGMIAAAKRPGLVKKLILVGSAPFEVRYAMGLMETRLGRLGEADRADAIDLMEKLGDPESPELSDVLARFGALMTNADTFESIGIVDDPPVVDFNIHQQVWAQAAEMRKSGELLNIAKKIRCPVVALHGDYDPHPEEGVRQPLGAVLDDLRFIKIAKCGHYPWNERHARDRFFDLLTEELSTTLARTL